MLTAAESYYEATVSRDIQFSRLSEDLSVDVCVVGGGYTGVSTSLHLARKGYSVALLEAERVGFGASGRNGGHVDAGPRNDPDELEQRLGKEKARTLWDMGVEASDLVRDLVAENRIDCDYKTGVLHVAAKANEVDEYKAHVDKLNNEYDYGSIRYVDKSELPQMLGSERYHGGTLDTGGAHLHPLKYLLGLAKAAHERGVKIFENSRVSGFSGDSPVTVKTDRGNVTARYLVMGCNGYLGKLNPKAARYMMPINNFVLATEPFSDEQARALIRDDVAVSDSLFVINYWRLSSDNRLVFGGGENYTQKFPGDIKGFVRKRMLGVYPQLENARIDYGWGGTLGITMNRFPSFGYMQPNILYAQGYSGHGISTATYAGKLMAEAIDGHAEKFNLISEVRVPMFPGGTLLRWPILALGMAYYSLLDKL